MNNREIAATFATLADMLEIKGESIHRILAYRRASETISELPRDLRAVFDEGGLTELDGIGATLAEKIEEMLTTGRLTFYEKLSAEVPPGVVEMLKVPGLGAKKVAKFWKEQGITSLAELQAAAEAGKLRDLPGMGAKSEQKILEGIAALSRRSDRVPLGDALPLAQDMLNRLLKVEGAIRGEIAGSTRRRKPTIGDIDLLIAAHDAAPMMAAFKALPQVASIIADGPTKVSVELHNGQQADLRVLPPQHFGTLLAYFTGSKDHNVRMRELALKQGLSLNEMSFTRVDGGPDIYCETEEAVYSTLGMQWVPPELREDRGEIEAALAHALPTLIDVGDMRGDLQLHTTWSDGKVSVLDMAKAALAQGRQYMLVTDHSYGLGVVGGVKVEDIPAQRAEIDAANAELAGAFRVLHGCECEIRADGSLDYDAETLKQFDIVLASMHTSLRQPREQITARLLRVIGQGQVAIIGHPRGQQIPDREPADLDMDQVFEAALRFDVALEINANPHRLDLDDAHARRAAELGVKLSISTDAHAPEHFAFMHYGVATARRAWIRAEQVINTWPLDRLLGWVEDRKR